MQISASIKSVIQQKLSERFPSVRSLAFTSVGGGSINETYCLRLEDKKVFCKMNTASRFPQLFQKETKGLELIGGKDILKTPAVIACFEQDDTQILLLEWIEPGERTENFWKRFGEGLAILHRATAGSFGLNENNYMGSVPQSNRQHKTWTHFFAEERLRPMMQRCFEKKQLSKTHLQQIEKLEKRLTEIFDEEKPALLHGDLWGGNFMCDAYNHAVLIDPAVYYGHRSMDLAMTTLFGGFRDPFYQAYNHHFPLPKNYREQWAVCNLYPLLIHLHLFGSSYLSQIAQTLKRLS